MAQDEQESGPVLRPGDKGYGEYGTQYELIPGITTSWIPGSGKFAAELNFLREIAIHEDVGYERMVQLVQGVQEITAKRRQDRMKLLRPVGRIEIEEDPALPPDTVELRTVTQAVRIVNLGEGPPGGDS